MIVADARGKPPNLTFAVAALPGCQWGPTTIKKTLTPWSTSSSRTAVFWPDLHRLGLWQAKGLPEQGLAWVRFFQVSLPALLSGIISKTPFAELSNPSSK